MKILGHYKNNPYLVQTETWIYGQIKYLKDFQPVVFCRGICNRDRFPLEKVRNINITDNPKPPRWERMFNILYNRLALAKAIRQDRPDIVHAHYGPSGYEFLPYKRKFRLPMVTTFYGYDVNMLPTRDPRWKERYRRLFSEGDLFLTEGSFMKQCLVHMGCEEKKVVVQHLGVDLENIRYEPRQINDGDELKVLIAGSFREKKGMPYALEGIGIFRQRRPDIKVKITVIGDSSGQPREEKEKSRILEVVKRYNLEMVVNFIGYQPHSVFIDELYKNHIFLSPSVTASDGDTEGGAPVSIIEASAAGMPILSTRHCDIPEVVVDGLSGYLSPEKDSYSISKNLEFLISTADTWKGLGCWGRAHIEKHYNLFSQTEQLEQIYKQVLSL